MEEDIKNEIKSDKNENDKALEDLIKCKAELDDTTDRLKRMMAEFENYKKRSLKERDNLYGSILSDIVEKLLPVLDNLEKAVETNISDNEFKSGIELVLKQYQDVLFSFGVKKIDTVGSTFDPEVHEAVSSIQDEKYGEKEIVQEFRTGYMIGTKIIRHAMVVVAN